MRVLITGNQGKIGRVTTSMAREAGYEVRGFDRGASPPVDWEYVPGDLLNAAQVRQVVSGCDAIAHLAAIPSDWGSQQDLVFNTNVTGTWNVLQAAVEAGIKKVIFFSSVNALGIWGGARRPDYLPVDDAHPHYPRPAYGLSKHLGEEMCESFTRTSGISTYCLRPSAVISGNRSDGWGRGNPEWVRQRRSGDYFSYIMVNDVARAVLCCLAHPGEGHHGRYILAADTTQDHVDTRGVLDEFFKDIPWRGASGYLDRPDRSLVDTSAARNDLGWRPQEESSQG